MARHIPAYEDFISEHLLERLISAAEPVPDLPGLRVAAGLRAQFPALETPEALAFMVSLYEEVREPLAQVLEQRKSDRAFIDAETRACVARNGDTPWRSPHYETVLGKRDRAGRIVVGPLPPEEQPEGARQPRPVQLPSFLRGEQVTLFGPPDTRKLSINAMNALHRKLPGEPELVAELVEASGQVPRWGADDEDSKTPLMVDFLHACENLRGCFDGTLRLDEPETGRTYTLATDKRALPIKRIPGLALPDGHHLVEGNPLPLHLVDFALHLWHLWMRPEALVFYIPKLENEEEAAYLHHLISAAERRLKALHPSYELGSVRVLLVFENPRAIFRIREMAAALSPYFVGGSLGWHDFLASTARLFRNDPHYRIPVKADPNIVINNIAESHRILVRELTPFGALKIGGMYGVLYEEGNPRSFQLSMVGYIRDVVTQLKRGLDGFWVAHPSFVRVGIALVEAWRRWEKNPEDETLRRLIALLVPKEGERVPLLAFVEGEDLRGLSPADPLYLRGVLAAEHDGSPVIANHDPEEVRYNIFQALQYLADWLSGNGCVALPATLKSAQGEKVFVRIMDDLATTERSRWELWMEVAHGRVSPALFEQLVEEEVQFIRADRTSETKRVQVKWTGEAARWYPVAVEMLKSLVMSPEPVEFVTQYLLPYTFAHMRSET
ncbi:MAG: hypothetical protein ACKO6N_22985 [Myxococcota bacterium]